MKSYRAFVCSDDIIWTDLGIITAINVATAAAKALLEQSELRDDFGTDELQLGWPNAEFYFPKQQLKDAVLDYAYKQVWIPDIRHDPIPVPCWYCPNGNGAFIVLYEMTKYRKWLEKELRSLKTRTHKRRTKYKSLKHRSKRTHTTTSS
jgi:hypothetical protein